MNMNTKKTINHDEEIAENARGAIESIKAIIASNDYDEIGVNLRMCNEYTMNIAELRAHELSSMKE